MGTKSESVLPTPALLLGIVFIILKLCNVINWSWWWVTLPFWGIFALILIALGICYIMKLFY